VSAEDREDVLSKGSSSGRDFPRGGFSEPRGAKVGIDYERPEVQAKCAAERWRHVCYYCGALTSQGPLEDPQTGAIYPAHCARDACLDRVGAIWPPRDGSSPSPLPGREFVASVEESSSDFLYKSLRDVLERAYDQASKGKGKARHGTNDDAFSDQLIVQIGRHCGGSTIFNVGQAWKKSHESLLFPREKAVAELLGAINYLAGAVIILESRSHEIHGGGPKLPCGHDGIYLREDGHTNQPYCAACVAAPKKES